MADNSWGPALGEHAFRSRLDFFLKYPDEKDSDVAFTTANHGLGCVRCKTAKPLEPCNNCGNPAYKLGLNRGGIVGLFCTQCNRGFSDWTCACGTENPITYETVLKKGSGGGCSAVVVFALFCLLITVAYIHWL
jgi:hypothetical protein